MENLYEKIVQREAKISLIGLGYVGLPIAIAFANKANVIGFDINRDKIEVYKKGVDPTGEVGSEIIKQSTIEFTTEEVRLQEAKFHIIAVPTPVKIDKTPDLTSIEYASQTLGRNLTEGSVIVYESTVYPGVTEDICVPILEKESGLKCGVDFKVGYSPERINPGDKEHNLASVIKVVSGMDEETVELVAKIYELVVDAGVYKAESIKVAEAAKVIENSQRDINIAFMNELSIIFNKLNIDTKSVLKAAATKWNFIEFHPGLVGGHCIGVDPYYLTYKAEQIGYSSQIILSGRKINDGMAKYVADSTVKTMIKARKQINCAKVAVFGVTFKEDCPDVRNSKVIDVIRELEDYGIDVKVVDPIADKEVLLKEYQISLLEPEEIVDMDAVIFAVPHCAFKNIRMDELLMKFVNIESLEGRNQGVLIDIKGLFDKKDAENAGLSYWRL